MIIRQTELKWIEGNPDIKPSNYFSADVEFNWMPLSWFSLSASVGGAVKSNQYSISYRGGGEGYEGIIGQYINGLNINSVQSSIGLAFKPFGGAVQIDASMDYQYNEVKGIRAAHEFRPKVSAAWYISDFSVGLLCSGPENFLQNGGCDVVKTDWQYGLNFNYGNGRLMCGLEVDNLFKKYRLTKTTTNNGPFYSNRLDWSRGRNVAVSVTYYFDYGKKVTPSIELTTPDTGSSSILGSE